MAQEERVCSCLTYPITYEINEAKSRYIVEFNDIDYINYFSPL